MWKINQVNKINYEIVAYFVQENEVHYNIVYVPTQVISLDDVVAVT